VQAAYKSLADELQAAHDDSEPDEAVIFRKDATRLRKAAQQLAPTLLRPPRPPPHAPQQQQQRWQPPPGGFANVGGLADVKRQLKEMVLLPLAHPHLMQQLGIQPPR
jgi:SpoVK/Ycf46/Vps4 family AAA+-type ATPase